MVQSVLVAQAAPPPELLAPLEEPAVPLDEPVPPPELPAPLDEPVAPLELPAAPELLAAPLPPSPAGPGAEVPQAIAGPASETKKRSRGGESQDSILMAGVSSRAPAVATRKRRPVGGASAGPGGLQSSIPTTVRTQIGP